MDESTVADLLALNREFYAAFADQFAGSRTLSDPALTSILPHIPTTAKVLDVGCGNGRLALLLDKERPAATYVGVDAVPELIAVARRQTEGLTSVSTGFHLVDIVQTGWAERLFRRRGAEYTEESSIPTEKPRDLCGTKDLCALGVSAVLFDNVVCLAVLHHIPGEALRIQLLRQMHDLLAADGRLTLSNWNFPQSPRLQKRVLTWTKIGIEETDVDPGDALLDWKRGGLGLRYVHHFSEAELDELAGITGFRLVDTFYSDGEGGRLGHYQIWRKR